MLQRRSSARPVITEIVDSRTINDVLDAAPARNRLEPGVQLILAEEAAIWIVSAITGIVQLLRLNHFVLKTKLLDDAIDLRALVSRQACGLSRDADRAWS